MDRCKIDRQCSHMCLPLYKVALQSYLGTSDGGCPKGKECVRQLSGENLFPHLLWIPSFNVGDSCVA